MPAHIIDTVSMETGKAAAPRRKAAGLPSGIVTFLFTDVEGSTQLWEEQPAQMSAALTRHDFLLRQEIEAVGGVIFKSAGDGFSAVFERPEAALTAAVAIQAALFSEAWPLGGEKKLRVRIALHTGPAELREGDYFGPPLNRTARLLAAAHGGQTILSEMTAVHLSGCLPAEVRLHSLGRHRLKDLSQLQEVFQALTPDMPGDFPALRSLGSSHHNLPAQLTSFIGRDAEMAAARNHLAQSRLLTLTGTGGCGKTRLALQVAAEVHDEYPDGVWLVELAALSDPALLQQEVAGVLGIREESEKRLRQTVIDALRPRSLLLILDNCEHLVDAAARLAENLLQACPNLTVLATSREALGIGGEAVLPLPPLGLPPTGILPLSPEALSRCEAVRFFVERASAALPTFRFSAGNAAAVASVCARLDGLPLALELAAARVRVLTPEQIDGRLDDRFRLLSGGSRTAQPRQQTLRRLVDWSYDLLGLAEQTLLNRLSVFSGGWSLDASETVCAGADEEGGEVETKEILELLSALVAKSLIAVETPVDGQIRYHLLESIHSYARERLAQVPGETQRMARSHRDFFLALAEEAEPKLTGPEQALWLDRLERDRENLRAALSFAHNANDLTLPRLAGALSWFWYGHSLLSEGTGWLEAALAQDATGAVLGKVLNGAGMLSLCCGDYNKSRAHHERDLALRRALEDPRGIARALGNLSNVACCQTHWDTAQGYGQESLTLYQELGDETSSAFVLNNLAAVASHRRDYPKAETLYREALSIHRRHGTMHGSADVLHNLGELYLRQRLYERAAPYFRDSLLAQKTLGNIHRVASTLTHLAEIAGDRGNDAHVCLLHAAADHLLHSSGITVSREYQQYQETLNRSHARLGEIQFQELWLQGRQMEAAQIIDVVLRSYSGLAEEQGENGEHNGFDDSSTARQSG